MSGLCYYDAGARNFYNTKKDIKSVADMKGLKIRVLQAKLMMDMVKLLGASPTPMAMGDIYSALQTNVIDGAENNWPSYISFSHYESRQHYTVDGHMRVPEILVASNARHGQAFQGRSGSDQEGRPGFGGVPEGQVGPVGKGQRSQGQGQPAARSPIWTTAAMAEFQKAMQPIYVEYKEYRWPDQPDPGRQVTTECAVGPTGPVPLALPVAHILWECPYEASSNS